jgi:hypothetical protein
MDERGPTLRLPALRQGPAVAPLISARSMEAREIRRKETELWTRPPRLDQFCVWLWQDIEQQKKAIVGQ